MFKNMYTLHTATVVITSLLVRDKPLVASASVKRVYYSLVPSNKNAQKGTFPDSATRARGRVTEMLYILCSKACLYVIFIKWKQVQNI